MKFKYQVYDGIGNKKEGFIEASSLEEAKQKLISSNFIVLDIKPVKHFSLNFSFSKKVKKSNLAKTLNILGLYLKASIPLIKALELTKKQEENKSIEIFLDSLYREIQEGKSLFNAIKSQNHIIIPEYIQNSIKVGEESGKLAIVLIEMSKFLKEEEKIMNKVSQAFIYPLFIIMVSIFMVSFMLTTVVPKIVKVFQNLHQNLPSITIFVINSGKFLQNNYILILILFTIIISSFVNNNKKIYKFKYFIDSMMLKLPIFSKIIISRELGRFSYLTYVLVNSGVNYIVAIKLAINTISNENIKNTFSEALNYVVEGKKLSVALKNANFNYDESFIQAISLAEETSEVENILKNLSEIYFEENENKINILLSLVEPLLIIIVGGIIGFIVTALLLPMTNLNVLKN